MQHACRLLLKHQNGVLPRRLDRLELGSAVGKSQSGQIDGLPHQRPRFQWRTEHDRIVVTDGQES